MRKRKASDIEKNQAMKAPIAPHRRERDCALGGVMGLLMVALGLLVWNMRLLPCPTCDSCMRESSFPQFKEQRRTLATSTTTTTMKTPKRDALPGSLESTFANIYFEVDKAWPMSGPVDWDAVRSLDSELAPGDIIKNPLPCLNRIAVNPTLDAAAGQHGSLGRHPTRGSLWHPTGVLPLNSLPEAAKADRMRAGGGFDVAFSDSLPLDRPTVDFRHDICKAQIFDLDSIGDASVIICFHNEPLSTLLRTVHSVLNTTPSALIREILLVDDRSTRADLGRRLDDHVSTLPKVSVMRLPRRLGIVHARLAGVHAASASVFALLDAHMEVNLGWLEPLLARLQESPESLVFPRIDAIDPYTFEPTTDRGIGTWLTFKWGMNEKGIVNSHLATTEPVPSLSTAGGVMAMRKDWFLECGGYDREFDGWGSENVELPLRVWALGGRVEGMVCSMTYHVFRAPGYLAYKTPEVSIAKNRIRTARMWMGELYPLARAAIGLQPQWDKFENGDYDHRLPFLHRSAGDATWVINRLLPQYVHHVRSMREVVLCGQLQFGNDLCLDSLGRELEFETIGTYECHGLGQNQAFALLTDGLLLSLFPGDRCLHPKPTGGVELLNCSFLKQIDHCWKSRDVVDRFYLIWGPRGNDDAGLCLAVQDGGLVLKACTPDTTWLKPSVPSQPPPLTYSTAHMDRVRRTDKRKAQPDVNYLHYIPGSAYDMDAKYMQENNLYTSESQPYHL